MEDGLLRFHAGDYVAGIVCIGDYSRVHSAAEIRYMAKFRPGPIKGSYLKVPIKSWATRMEQASFLQHYSRQVGRIYYHLRDKCSRNTWEGGRGAGGQGGSEKLGSYMLSLCVPFCRQTVKPRMSCRPSRSHCKKLQLTTALMKKARSGPR